MGRGALLQSRGLRTWLGRVREITGRSPRGQRGGLLAPPRTRSCSAFAGHFPDHEDTSYQHVTPCGVRVALIQDYFEREAALAALGGDDALAPATGA